MNAHNVNQDTIVKVVSMPQVESVKQVLSALEEQNHLDLERTLIQCLVKQNKITDCVLLVIIVHPRVIIQFSVRLVIIKIKLVKLLVSHVHTDTTAHTRV